MSYLRDVINSTGVYRKTVLKEKKDEFKRCLEKEIKLLIRKVDDESITNSYIRSSIKKLADKSGVSIGAAQKVINVFLKYYCFIADKINLIEELDCPIDSNVKRYFKLGDISLKKLDFNEYLDMQKKIKNKCNIRIYGDIVAYDEKVDKKRCDDTSIYS